MGSSAFLDDSPDFVAIVYRNWSLCSTDFASGAQSQSESTTIFWIIWICLSKQFFTKKFGDAVITFLLFLRQL